MDSVPQYLYKYRSMKEPDFTRDIFVNNRLYCSSPTGFNDPFDSSPKLVFEGTDNQKESYVRKLSSSFCDDELSTKLESLHLEENGYANFLSAIGQDALDSVQEDMHSHTKLLCLSSVWNNILMWSHYADEHAGICIRFNTKVVPSSATGGVGFDKAKRIIYSNERRAVNLLIQSNERTSAENAQLLEDVLFHKYKPWEYEEEWRIVTKVGNIGDGNYFPFPLGVIDGVYLGANMNEANEEIVRMWISNHNPDVEVIKTRLSTYEYVVEAVS